MKYIHCYNCGKYFKSNSEKGFCCTECEKKYKRCENCGRFFNPENSPTNFCSKECETDYQDFYLRMKKKKQGDKQ